MTDPPVPSATVSRQTSPPYVRHLLAILIALPYVRKARVREASSTDDEPDTTPVLVSQTHATIGTAPRERIFHAFYHIPSFFWSCAYGTVQSQLALRTT